MSTLKLYQWYMDATKCSNGNGVLNMVTAIWKFFSYPYWKSCGVFMSMCPIWTKVLGLDAAICLNRDKALGPGGLYFAFYTHVRALQGKICYEVIH